MIEFSVIIPIYNTEKYLTRCINSIINQTYKKMELILVDDGSTDDSKKICDKFARDYEMIKVVHQKNRGVSAARNVGLQLASNEYIVFVDSDDWIERETLENLYNVIKHNETDCIVFNLKEQVLKKIENKNQTQTWEEEIEKLIITERINSPVNKVYRNSIIKNNNIKFDEEISIGEDLLFNIEYFTSSKKIYILNKELYHYEVSNNKSLTKKYKEDKYEQLMYVNDRIKKITNSLESTKIKRAILYVKLKSICSCILELFHENCKYSTQKKVNFIKKIRKENGIIVVKNINLKIFLISLVYSFLPAKMLLITFKLINLITRG